MYLTVFAWKHNRGCSCQKQILFAFWPSRLYWTNNDEEWLALTDYTNYRSCLLWFLAKLLFINKTYAFDCWIVCASAFIFIFWIFYFCFVLSSYYCGQTYISYAGFSGKQLIWCCKRAREAFLWRKTVIFIKNKKWAKVLSNSQLFLTTPFCKVLNFLRIKPAKKPRFLVDLISPL